MTNYQVLTGDEARKTLRQQKTKGRCGYFEMQYGGAFSGYEKLSRWFVWCNRGPELRGIRQNSEEACKRFLL